MKRSEINRILREGHDFIRSFSFHLPGFARLTPDQMRERRVELSGIISSRLGWDITDYGQNDFENLGLFLFTCRNGSQRDMKRGGTMCYAEKIMISRRDQISPMHRHIVKSEDIINRGGARLALKMFSSDKVGNIDSKAEVLVITDGFDRRLSAGETLLLAPGESVTLKPGNWHAFWGEGGDVLIGEVSSVNDDLTDNIFADPLGRFAEIEEDEAPLHLLVSDYDKWLAPQG